MKAKSEDIRNILIFCLSRYLDWIGRMENRRNDICPKLLLAYSSCLTISIPMTYHLLDLSRSVKIRRETVVGHSH